MLLKHLYARLEKSSEFKNFQAQNQDAFLCAGFFIMNFKTQVFEYSLDYRNDKQIFTFKIPEREEEQVVMQTEEIIQVENKKPLEKITLDVQVDIEDLKEIIEKALENNSIKNKLEEFIAVLQKIDSSLVWHLTCICEGFTILNVIINPETGAIEKFEKKNLLDFVKKP
jgi:hypothetical protein